MPNEDINCLIKSLRVNWKTHGGIPTVDFTEMSGVRIKSALKYNCGVSVTFYDVLDYNGQEVCMEVHCNESNKLKIKFYVFEKSMYVPVGSVVKTCERGA